MKGAFGSASRDDQKSKLPCLILHSLSCEDLLGGLGLVLEGRPSYKVKTNNKTNLM